MSNLSEIKTVLFDQDTDLRPAIRHMLRDSGLKDICDTEHPRIVIKELLEKKVDLLICDLEQGDEIMCKTVKELRAQNLSDNPFPVTIGLTGNSDQEHLSRAVNAGFDSVLLKPIELSTLKKRVLSFVTERKPFVITANYIGPDRRGANRPNEASAELVDVPNPVGLIADGMTRRVLLAHIDEHRERLVELKGKCDIDSIVWIAEQMNVDFAAPTEESRFPALSKQLKRSAACVSKRYRDEGSNTVKVLCDELDHITAKICENPMEVEYVDIDRLMTVSKDIRKAICDQRESPADSKSAVTLAVMPA